MPKSKGPRKQLSRQVRDEYIAAARRRAQVKRQKTVAMVAVGLSLILGVFGVTALTGKQDNDKTNVNTATTSAVDRAAAACPPVEGSKARRTIFENPPPMCIDPVRKLRARFVTSAGIFTAELDPRISPLAVNSFVFLARWRFYEGLPFHKTIPNNYVQTGDPKGAGITGPGYFVKDDPLPAEGSYRVGDLLMAHEARDQNGSQFLILVGDGPQGTLLPAVFPRFGRVTRGIDVLQKIAMDGAATGSARIEHLIQSVEITPIG